MTFPDVESLIPHRGAHRVVSHVVSCEGLHIVTAGVFSAADLVGHFPGNPIVPGVTMVEGLAQSLACLAGLAGERGQAVLTGIEKARFRGIAFAPCTLTFDVEVTERRLGVTWARGKVMLEGRTLATVNLQAAVLPPAGE